MGEREPTRSWWQTLPGIITGVAALITAVAGLIVAINQTGWFSRAPSVGAPSVRSEPASSTQLPVGTRQQTAAVSTSAIAIALPARRDHELGDAVFTLLGATLSPRNSENNTLAIRVQMRNDGRYPANFGDQQFRLLVDGVPQAPVAGLNEVVAAQSAEVGELTFVVPRAVTAVQLRILSGDESSEVALDFAAPAGP